MPEASGSRVVDESDYSTFENKTGLAEDMKFLASMPELCDVTFLVGDTREPVCAVKAVLAARSRLVSCVSTFFMFFFLSSFPSPFFHISIYLTFCSKKTTWSFGRSWNLEKKRRKRKGINFVFFRSFFFLIHRVFHKMLYQAPSPQRKKEPPTRENKIRLFLKRSSEPLLNLQNPTQQVN